MKTQIAMLTLLGIFLIAGCGANRERMYNDLQGIAEKGSSEAQYHLGMFYNNGIGTEANQAEAYKWFSRSADNGDPLGHYKLGCYYAGQAEGIVSADPKLALHHKLIAADAGYSLAQWDVAVAYYKDGNINEAIAWWKKAANQGDPQSFYNLHVVYYERRTDPEDREWAYRYLAIIERNSAENEKPKIQERLVELKAGLSRDQIAASEDWIASWKSEKSDLTARAQSGLSDTQRVINSELTR